jgi:hypothetical protein
MSAVPLWTEEESSYLESNYNSLGVLQCAEDLQRTPSSITNKARRMGLTIAKPFERQTKTHDKYESELVGFTPIEPYINSRTAISHTCANGHTFKAPPNKVLAPTFTCTKCSAIRFHPNKPSVLYLASFSEYYLLGVSYREPKIVYRSVWKELGMKLEWSIFYNSGLEALSVRNKILNNNSAHLIDTGLLPCGNSETLSVYISKESILND